MRGGRLRATTLRCSGRPVVNASWTSRGLKRRQIQRNGSTFTRSASSAQGLQWRIPSRRNSQLLPTLRANSFHIRSIATQAVEVERVAEDEGGYEQDPERDGVRPPRDLDSYKLLELALDRKRAPSGSDPRQSTASGPPPKSHAQRVTEAQNKTYTGVIPPNVFPQIVRAIRSARVQGLPDQTGGLVGESEKVSADERAAPVPINKFSVRRLKEGASMRASREWAWQQTHPKYLAKREARRKLPIMAASRDREIMAALTKADVLIIPGETGSGKSTQVPQIILDWATERGRAGFTNVISAQPRRLSAKSIAARVAFERNEEVGDRVGHQVRFDREAPRSYGVGSILFCTTGVLWNTLTYQNESFYDNYTHVILDEVHMRTAEMDILLLTLRNELFKRRAAGQPCPKLILMSATIDTQKFVDYFTVPGNESASFRTSVYYVPGRTYPVVSQYLEDMLPA
ncbi:Dosage compensation regulator [Cyphellophora attinorum]|uniref:Dosage compensation regulator n=1 Tax=Cyphellophora attinorum TaxID=1664694 RepID=A0A0N1HVG6_9EURO|nr:Dosage compensation regulator [Phialophora attinorum]KPI41274.1 Dosage compensation regulator [Phialophora attinorum]